jgi:hypothetical protein
MKKTFIWIILMLIPSIFADVEEISNYNLTVDLSNEHITNVITIKNIANYPIVPGIGELRLQKEEIKRFLIIPIPFIKEKKPIEIENLKGYYIINNQEHNLDVNVSYKDSYSVIEYQIWEPIDKGEEITLVIEYNADVVDDGILFKTVTIPVGCDLNIKRFNINFKTNYHLTYQEPSGNSFQIPKNRLLIIKAEFSILPLPKLPIYGHVLFWLAVIVILIAIFVFIELRRRGER